jgi:hypothetical protein
MFHVTSAQVESQTAHIDTPKTHLSPTDQDNHAKIAQQIAIPELVHSETPQVVVHSETSEKEDNYENLLAAAGTPGRVVQAFTLLQESPEAQVCLSDLVWQMPGDRLLLLCVCSFLVLSSGLDLVREWS